MTEFRKTEAATNVNADRSVVVQQWDRADGPLESIIDAVTQATDIGLRELPMLYDVIDPDALDALLGANEHSERDRTATSVSFVYGDCAVTVEATGRTVASPVDD